MLQNNHLVGFGAQRDSHKLFDIVTRMGLVSSCTLCLDAADETSYTSGQTIVDRIGANNYFLGTVVGVDAADPTFVGAAGTPDAYFTFDGGDYFVRTAAQVWDADFHKAAGAFTFVSLFYPDAVKVSNSTMWSNRDNVAASAGVVLTVTDLMKVQLRRSITTATSVGDTSTALVTEGAWNVVMAGWSDASSLVRMQINGTHESQSGLQSTDTDAVSGVQTVCSLSGGGRILEAGERWAGMLAFNRMLDAGEMASLRSLISGTRPGYV
jgi:hypothetical protein